MNRDGHSWPARDSGNGKAVSEEESDIFHGLTTTRRTANKREQQEAEQEDNGQL